MSALLKIFAVTAILSAIVGIITGFANPITDTAANYLTRALGYLYYLSPFMNVNTLFVVIFIFWTFIYIAVSLKIVQWLAHHFTR